MKNNSAEVGLVCVHLAEVCWLQNQLAEISLLQLQNHLAEDGLTLLRLAEVGWLQTHSAEVGGIVFIWLRLAGSKNHSSEVGWVFVHLAEVG